MHWQMFVALCFSFNSQELSQQGLTPSSFFVLELDKAGKLPVPSLLIHDLEYLPAAAQSLRLRGYSKNHDVFFLFVFSPRGNIPQVFSEELEALHLDKEQFETIAQTGDQLNLDYEIYYVGNQDTHSNKLLVKGVKGTALFLLLGKQERF